MEVIQGEAKPLPPCASSLGLAQKGISQAITSQTRSTSHKEEERTAASQRAGGQLFPAHARQGGPHGHTRHCQSTSLGYQHSSPHQGEGGCSRRLHGTRAKAKLAKLSKSAFFARERKMKPPVSEPHHFHLPFNQPLPASPTARPSQVQAVILFLSQKGACGLACWIWQFIKQIKSLA